MKSFSRNLYVAIIASLLAIVGQAYGNALTYGESEDCCFVSSPCCDRGFIIADLLYWRAHQGGFNCGCAPGEMNNYVNENGNVISKFKGDRKDPHFKWDAGFRIGAGYDFDNQNWEIAAYWTHFHTHNKQHHFRWKLDFEVLDVLVGRNFCVESFVFMPFIGIRAAQIEQKVKTTSLTKYNIAFNTSSFSSFSNSSSSTNSSIRNFRLAEENNKEDFRGIGPLIGIEADWNLGCGFSLYAYAYVSSLYGHFNVKFNGSNTFLNGTNICHKKAHFNSCQIATDALLGICWEQCFCGNMEWIFLLAVEQHRYFDQNHIGDYGDLCLDGVSFSVGISF